MAGYIKKKQKRNQKLRKGEETGGHRRPEVSSEHHVYLSGLYHGVEV